MGAFRKWSIPALLIAAYFVAISALPAQANDVPPSSTNSFYGDATGDMIIAAADIAQMNAWMLGFPYAYDTVQPQTATQDWNTSDVTSDALIAAADLSVINNWMLGFPVSVDDKPWALSNENLPASIAVNTPTAFQVNLSSTLGTQFGRAGLPVIANIDAANSTATGSLAGRTCSPVVGSRDQAASSGAQCAISVTVTDWYGPAGPTKGLTETGTYGFSVTATTPGNLRIIFSISGNPPGLDIPAVTLGVTVTITLPVGWTWISGSNARDQNGVYGTKGVPASANIPGARWWFVSWTDGTGNFWLFGGNIDGSHFYNDLWRWDGVNWTWMSGANTLNQYGVYGTKGVPAAANVPGSRCGAISWKDTSGNLWLFGGWGYAASGTDDYLNDLWKWNGSKWTWISGSSAGGQYGVYGTKGVPASANHPGARSGAVSWADATGNLWLFGGYGNAAASMGHLNDLWRWDGTNWTWISGSNTVDRLGVYGTKGMPAPANVPGSRECAVSWKDASGNFWLFGGAGYTATGGWQSLNDLWRWDGANWTWISGSSSGGQYGIYGTQGVPAPANVPGLRYSPVSWIDTTGNLWLFGGQGYDSIGPSAGRLNDLWRWDGANWTWISGSKFINQSGVYGTEGVPDPSNVPGGRYGAVSWIDGTGKFWLFGGEGYDASGNEGCLNDLWRYNP